jgi:hypothetical protein
MSTTDLHFISERAQYAHLNNTSYRHKKILYCPSQSARTNIFGDFMFLSLWYYNNYFYSREP